MSEMPLSADDLVLIADDEAFSRVITIEQLDQLGRPKIHTARDGAEALAMLREPWAAELRLIILDFNMPGANGIEILREIRCGRLAVPHDVMVMMITSIGVFGLVAAAVALDVDVFLSKPTKLADLRRYLVDLLAAERDCARPDHYSTIDLNWVTSLAAEAIEPTLGPGEEIALSELREGMVLAANLLDERGELLFSAGWRVTARMLRLLHGLAAAGLSFAGLKVIRPAV